MTRTGKVLTVIRYARRERLYDMAQKLGVSSAWLSGVENGRHPVPASLAQDVEHCYALTGREAKALWKAVMKDAEGGAS